MLASIVATVTPTDQCRTVTRMVVPAMAVRQMILCDTVQQLTRLNGRQSFLLDWAVAEWSDRNKYTLRALQGPQFWAAESRLADYFTNNLNYISSCVGWQKNSCGAIQKDHLSTAFDYSIKSSYDEAHTIRTTVQDGTCSSWLCHVSRR